MSFAARCGICRHWCRCGPFVLLAVPLLFVSASDALGQAVEARPLGRDLAVYRPADTESGPAQPRAIDNPTGPISLRDALALALLQSPELATFAWEVRAREARILQAGRVPNPVISVLVEDVGRSTGFISAGGSIQPQTTIQFSQVIELGGKRTARTSVAALTRDLAAWDFETARIDVLTRVTQAFLDVLASQEAVELAEETTRVVEQVQQTVEVRVAAGVVSPIEQTRADVALAAIRIEGDRARRLFDADRRRLAALWGSPVARFASAVGDLTNVPAVPSFAALQARLSENPALARWATEISHREAALDVERSRGVPDLTLSGGYRRFSELNSHAFLVGVSVPLPLFDRKRGAIQDASDRVSKAYEEQRSTQARVTAMLAEAYRALASAQDEVAALASDVLPGARSVFDAVEEGYRLGRFGYLDVLDAQRTLVAARLQSLRALSEYHKAATEIERLIGAPLVEVGAVAPASLQ